MSILFFFPFYLQAVGEDDIGVHRPDIQMVDEGAFDPVWDFLQRSQLLFDLIADLNFFLQL